MLPKDLKWLVLLSCSGISSVPPLISPSHAVLVSRRNLFLLSWYSSGRLEAAEKWCATAMRLLQQLNDFKTNYESKVIRIIWTFRREGASANFAKLLRCATALNRVISYRPVLSRAQPIFIVVYSGKSFLVWKPEVQSPKMVTSPRQGWTFLHSQHTPHLL